MGSRSLISTTFEKVTHNFSEYKHHLLYLTLFISFLVVAKLTPFTGDDWYWGSYFGVTALANHFDGVNGRWAGNLIIIITTRFEIAQLLIESLVNVGIVVSAISIIRFFSPISHSRAFIAYMFATILIPISVWAQTYFWSSGFANYNVSALTILLLIRISLPLFFKRTENSKVGLIANCIVVVGIFLLAFINQLFVENQTIFMLAASLIVLIFAIKNRHGLHKAIALIVGSVLGAWVMFFSNDSYQGMFYGDSEGFRHIGSSPLASLLEIYSTRTLNFLFYDGIYIFLFLSIVIAVTMRKTTAQKVIGAFCVAFCSFLIFWPLVIHESSILDFPLLNTLTALLSIVFMLVSILALLLQRDKSLLPLALILATSYILVLIFSIQSTFGPRNFLLTFILINIVTVSLLVSVKHLRKEFFMYLAVPILAFTLAIGYGLVSNYQTSVANENVIKVAIQEDAPTIKLTRYRFPNLGQHLNPNERRIERMKIFYGINPDTEVSFE